MMRYLDDGRLKIDNNLAENEIRPVTLDRKNYLFCGNHEAAENMCVIISLLSTCRNHDVNPREYLGDIIARMPYMEKPPTSNWWNCCHTSGNCNVLLAQHIQQTVINYITTYRYNKSNSSNDSKRRDCCYCCI